MTGLLNTASLSTPSCGSREADLWRCMILAAADVRGVFVNALGTEYPAAMRMQLDDLTVSHALGTARSTQDEVHRDAAVEIGIDAAEGRSIPAPLCDVTASRQRDCACLRLN